MYILVCPRDDIVCPFGEGQYSAGYEAVVAAGSGLAGERGDNVVYDVGGDGWAGLAL